ncbi:hypothetical protein V8J88_01155 [Massilia sp. W12]|uniref:hypothetical protein n=1 Tax=Massilia sp. W12 TaxID=3126507 RepID=UPI0030D018D0
MHFTSKNRASMLATSSKNHKELCKILLDAPDNRPLSLSKKKNIALNPGDSPAMFLYGINCHPAVTQAA